MSNARVHQVWKWLLWKFNTKTTYKVSRSVRIGKNCTLGLEYGTRPAASGRTWDLLHSFSQYGPPSWQITYIFTREDKKFLSQVLRLPLLEPHNRFKSTQRWCGMIETSSTLPRKSSATFGSLRQSSVNVRKRSSSLRNNLESLRKSSEIVRKSSESRQKHRY